MKKINVYNVYLKDDTIFTCESKIGFLAIYDMLNCSNTNIEYISIGKSIFKKDFIKAIVHADIIEVK